MTQPPIVRSPDTATTSDPSATSYGRPVRLVPDGAFYTAFLASESFLSSIDGKIPSLGQALASGSTPVVLPVAQETSLRDVSDRAARLLGHVTVDASALPSGAATALLQGTTFDLDTGVGTQNVAGVSLRKSASGGSVELGTATDPVRTDPTGTTTQPVSGTVTLGAGSAVVGHVVTDSGSTTAVTSLPSLPTGANTIGKVDQGAGGASAWKVDGSAVTQPVSGTTTSNQGTPVATASGWPVKVTDGTNVQAVKAASTAALAADPSAVVALSPNSPTPTGSNTIGAVTAPGAAALALDATLTGGTQKAIARGGVKGATTAADVTSSSQGADHQGLDVLVRDASGNPMPSLDVAARRGFVSVTDGTNTQAVKAASTAAAAADPSAVVALSPNSPVPAGTNTIGAVTTPTTTPTSLADVSSTTSAAAFGSLTAGPSGILVTAHPNNSAIVRVSGSDVSATKGQPLQAGASFLFSVTNSNVLSHVAETGTQTICVTAV